jgi:hypothetical protein
MTEQERFNPEIALPAYDAVKVTSPVLRILAHLFSVLFHPLFIPLYLTAFLVFVHPYYFAGWDQKARVFMVIRVFVSMVLLPAFTVFLLWRLGFAKSIFLRTAKERIIPYAAAMIFFFWAYYVFRNRPDDPRIMAEMSLGVFLTICAAFIINNYIKISMHAMAMGGMVVFVIATAMSGAVSLSVPVMIALLVAGITCTSRLIVSDHHPVEIYAGFIVGAVCQVVASIIAG